ncbi:TniQ family protein [Alishewanella sp. HL-SH05]|uniref:TniQ family protein n=1 Tax=Alishewanella sp. HL-SH05 TaxID=3461145 RepID=UPI0040415C58
MQAHLISFFEHQVPMLPEEYLPGYLARLFEMTKGVNARQLMSFNGSTQLGKLHQLFPRVASCFAYRESASECGDTLLERHLGARFWLSFVPEDDYREHIEQIMSRPKSKRSVFCGEETLNSLKPMKFCSECRNNDIKRYGASFWRANQQLTSIFYCDEHNKPLNTFKIDNKLSLKNYPVINDEVLEASIPLSDAPLLRWLHDETTVFLSAMSIEDNRYEISRIKWFITRALGTKQSGGKLIITRSINQDWRSFLAMSLSQLCMSETSYIDFADRSMNSLTRLIAQDAPVSHPLIFLLAKKYAQELTLRKII